MEKIYSATRQPYAPHEYFIYASLGKLPQRYCRRFRVLGPLTLALLSIKQRRDYIWVGLAILGIALMVPWHQANANQFFS